ncbi:MAG: WecB/TagA/CpsF family glycosyltransferase [Pseudomonadota bacterium]
MQLTGRNFSVKINCATRAALLDAVRARFAQKAGFALATINLDHVTKLERDADFRQAYAAHDLVVADGNPIVWVARLARRRLELVPGSELVEPLTALAAETGTPVALIGSSDEALAGAALALQRHAPGIDIVMKHAPAFGFNPEGEAAQAILADIDACGAGLVFLALGAPKQERFAALGRRLAPQAGFASVGAGLDFLSGHQTRAPKWVQAIAMEWLWRMLGNPRRLVKRYTLCALAIPGLAWRALGQRFRSV